MSAIRVPLLSAFVGGCLSSAVLFGLWRAEGGAGAPAAAQHRPLIVESASPAASVSIAVRSGEPPPELAAAVAQEHAPPPAEPPASQPSQVQDSGGPSTAGSAVSDVLMGLEAAYRAREAAAAPAPAAPPEERAVAAAPSQSALAPTGAPPEAPPQAVAALAPTAVPVAVASVAVAPAAVAPVAVASIEPTSAPPEIPAAPAFVAQENARPSEVHIGDVNQNTYVSNVRQGDVYVIQPQPLVMLQYLQLLGMSSGLAAPAAAPAPARHGRGARAPGVAFSSTLTNPDNPWGFHFRPPHLVH
ncbi:MAG: hypothetical protein ABI488_17245 [Polyangiaceae bacterium]